MPDKPEPSGQQETDLPQEKQIEISPVVEKVEFQEETEKQLTSWQDFYDRHFGVQINAGKIKIPERTAEEKEKFTRLIVVNKGLTFEGMVDECRKYFQLTQILCPDLEGLYEPPEADWKKAIRYNNRDANKKPGPYAVWIENLQNAYEERMTGNLGDGYSKERIKGMTLTERLLFELKYFEETGEHLDSGRDEQRFGAVTLCTDSLLYKPKEGFVSGCNPIVSFQGKGMIISKSCGLVSNHYRIPNRRVISDL